MLLGIPGDNTFANCQEANRALWRLTLLPMADKVLAGLTRWLGEAFGDAVTLLADRDALPALAAEREALWTRLGAAAFLTPNEKRAAVGLDPVEGGEGLAASAPPGEVKANRADEQARVPAGNPEGGQFTSEGSAGRSEGRVDGEEEGQSDMSASEEVRMEDLKIDESFLDAREDFLLAANVPEDKDGNIFDDSGVTVGGGVDLGQQGEADLRRRGVPETLIEKLKPWLGLRREEARRFLESNPLILSREEAQLLTDRVRGGIGLEVARNFNRDSQLRFEDLPSEAQTVIASVATQFGPNLSLPSEKGGTPRFWKFVTRGDWQSALEELRDFGDRFQPRRDKEADKLLEAFPDLEDPGKLSERENR